MTDINTSVEAVERLAVLLTDPGPIHVRVRLGPPDMADQWHCGRPGWAQEAAATLRALVRERDKARAARSQAVREIGEQARAAGVWQGLADKLEAQRDAAWQAGAEAMREATAQLCEERFDNSLEDCFSILAATIRALPIPERPT